MCYLRTSVLISGSSVCDDLLMRSSFVNSFSCNIMLYEFDLQCFCCTTLRDVIFAEWCSVSVMSTTCVLQHAVVRGVTAFAHPARQKRATSPCHRADVGTTPPTAAADPPLERPPAARKAKSPPPHPSFSLLAELRRRKGAASGSHQSRRPTRCSACLFGDGIGELFRIHLVLNLK